MNIQVRLEKLAKKVEEKRNSGFVQSWSEDIKREAIFLARAVDFVTVVKVTKLRTPCFDGYSGSMLPHFK